MEMVRMAESGERKFKPHLTVHGNAHSKVKAFKCDVEGCTKKFAHSSGLAMHKKVYTRECTQSVQNVGGGLVKRRT
jgi:hypothetical protein